MIIHAAKILLRECNKRMKRIMEENVVDEQFGFRKGMGTSDAIGVVRSVMDRYLEKGRNVSLCFVDLEKAFDYVV